MPKRLDKSKEKKIARERLRALLKMADEVAGRDIGLSERYGELARRISARTRVPIPKEWKWRYCKRCKRLLFPGITASVRTSSRDAPHLILKCLKCGNVNRRPYAQELVRRREGLKS